MSRNPFKNSFYTILSPKVLHQCSEEAKKILFVAKLNFNERMGDKSTIATIQVRFPDGSTEKQNFEQMDSGFEKQQLYILDPLLKEHLLCGCSCCRYSRTACQCIRKEYARDLQF